MGIPNMGNRYLNIRNINSISLRTAFSNSFLKTQIMSLDYVSNLFAWSKVGGGDLGFNWAKMRYWLKKFLWWPIRENRIWLPSLSHWFLSQRQLLIKLFCEVIKSVIKCAFNMYPLMPFSFAYMDVQAMWLYLLSPHPLHPALAGEVLEILQTEITIFTS